MRFVILAMTDQNDASVNLAVARLINPLFPLEDPLFKTIKSQTVQIRSFDRSILSDGDGGENREIKQLS